MKQGPVSFALALLLLGAQLAVAAHEPVHAEETVSACGEASSHFCAPHPDHEAGRCALCHAGSMSLALDPPEAVRALPAAVVHSAPESAPALSSGLDPASAPRAPPVG